MAFGDFTVDRNSTKYVLGSGGTIISYATDEPAFEFNADGSYKGILVEPAATNLLTYSDDFSDASWNAFAKTNTISADTIVSPDGTSNADAITAGQTDSSLAKSGISGSASTTYTFSFWGKVPSGTQAIKCQIANQSNVTLGGSEEFVFTTQWQRFSFNRTLGAGDTGMTVAIGGFSSFNTGDIIHLWGAQVEEGPIATSYIPTTTASVTRTKDDITLGSASSLIGQTEGTLYVEVDWKGATGTTQHILDVTDGTNNNRLVIYNSTSVELRMVARANNVLIVDQGVSSSGFSGIQKIALAYKTDDFELYRNGSSIASDTSASLTALATLTDIDLGQRYNTNEQANMWIRAVALYPKRLSDAEAQALTTL